MTGLQKNRTGRPVRRSNRRFERFNTGLITKRFIERTEPDSSPVDGWTGPIGRFDPIFKTMAFTVSPLVNAWHASYIVSFS